MKFAEENLDLGCFWYANFCISRPPPPHIPAPPLVQCYSRAWPQPLPVASSPARGAPTILFPPPLPVHSWLDETTHNIQHINHPPAQYGPMALRTSTSSFGHSNPRSNPAQTVQLSDAPLSHQGHAQPHLQSHPGQPMMDHYRYSEEYGPDTTEGQTVSPSNYFVS